MAQGWHFGRNRTYLLSAIPTLRVTSIDTSLPFYEALGFEVAWQHRLTPEAPRLTSVRQSSVELFLAEHPLREPIGGSWTAVKYGVTP